MLKENIDNSLYISIYKFSENEYLIFSIANLLKNFKECNNPNLHTVRCDLKIESIINSP